jgi:hypothetical protein
MIKTNIAREYPHHIKEYTCEDRSIYITDYRSKKGVEISVEPPAGIEYFSLLNDYGLKIGSIVFNKKSFVYPDGKSRSQCECVVFPDVADNNSWTFFAELKYSDEKRNNRKNLQKAIRQLYKTRTYYFQKGIFGKDNTCYLAASLPMQSEPFPFANFILPPKKLQSLKGKHNVVLRLTNKAEIVNTKMIII